MHDGLTVLADPRQVEHEGLLELEPDLVLRLATDLLVDRLHDGVEVPHLAGALRLSSQFADQVILGVLARDEGLRPGDREVVAERRLDEVR